MSDYEKFLSDSDWEILQNEVIPKWFPEAQAFKKFLSSPDGQALQAVINDLTIRRKYEELILLFQSIREHLRGKPSEDVGALALTRHEAFGEALSAWYDQKVTDFKNFAEEIAQFKEQGLETASTLNLIANNIDLWSQYTNNNNRTDYRDEAIRLKHQALKLIAPFFFPDLVEKDAGDLITLPKV